MEFKRIVNLNIDSLKKVYCLNSNCQKEYLITFVKENKNRIFIGACEIEKIYIRKDNVVVHIIYYR